MGITRNMFLRIENEPYPTCVAGPPACSITQACLGLQRGSTEQAHVRSYGERTLIQTRGSRPDGQRNTCAPRSCTIRRRLGSTTNMYPAIGAGLDYARWPPKSF